MDDAVTNSIQEGGIKMVEDSQIKAQVSPFAIREGEIKTFDGKDGYVSMNQIVHKIDIGHINEIHFAIFHPKYYFNAFADSNYNYRRIFYRKLCG